MKSKKVSIIIVNYNGLAHLEKCLTSVLAQTYTNFEIIIVDNNSTDGSLEYLKKTFPSLTIIESKENLGYARGVNLSLAYTHGDYIATLNYDTEVEKDWLAQLVKTLESDSVIGAVTSGIFLYHDRKTVNTLGLDIHITGLGFTRGLNSQVDKIPGGTFRVSGVSGCSCLIRKEILEKTHGLNPDLIMYYDDVDLSWQINLMGYDIYCVPRSIVYHKYNLKMNPQKYYYLELGRLSLLYSTFKPTTLLLCLPFLIMTEILSWGYCLLKGKEYLKTKFKTLNSLYADRDKIKARRSELHQMRMISDFQLIRKLKINYKWSQMLHILPEKRR